MIDKVPIHDVTVPGHAQKYSDFWKVGVYQTHLSPPVKSLGTRLIAQCTQGFVVSAFFIVSI